MLWNKCSKGKAPYGLFIERGYKKMVAGEVDACGPDPLAVLYATLPVEIGDYRFVGVVDRRHVEKVTRTLLDDTHPEYVPPDKVPSEVRRVLDELKTSSQGN